MPNTYTVTPAYGREYKSKAEVLKDWNDNKDFKMASFYGSGYVNKADALKYFAKGDWVQIRYANLTKVCLVKI